MPTYIRTNLVYNELEYFSYLNHWLLFLFFLIVCFYSILRIMTFCYGKVDYNNTLIEFLSCLFLLLFLIFIVSPSLLILLDIDYITIPSFILYNLGFQWAWTYSISYLHSNIGYTSYQDHYIISTSFYSSLFTTPMLSTVLLSNTSILNNNEVPIIRSEPIEEEYNTTLPITEPIEHLNTLSITSILTNNIYSSSVSLLHYPHTISSLFTTLLPKYSISSLSIPSISYSSLPSNCFNYSYLLEVSSYLIIPLWSCIKIYCLSLDVIHSLGFSSLGFKIDVIPGRMNLVSSLRLNDRGISKGFCYELCGEQHSNMTSNWISN